MENIWLAWGLTSSQTYLLDKVQGGYFLDEVIVCVCVCVCIYIYIYLYMCVCLLCETSVVSA